MKDVLNYLQINSGTFIKSRLYFKYEMTVIYPKLIS